jgi:DNA-binding response OmpR family regulator
MRVLVVEDQKNVARFIVNGLREQTYAVDLALDGEQGLFRAETEEYDLIVLDLMLPKVGGLEICRRLRAQGKTTPVLMLTARDDKATRLRGFDTGADDYLTKPFDFDELLARVRALLRRGARMLPTRLRVADLELEPSRREAIRDGRVIPLTAKEYALLDYLMRNPRRVVTRDEISTHVWDERFDPFSNVIEVYVARLRKKIDQDAEVKLLHTRRGVGYLLEVPADES